MAAADGVHCLRAPAAARRDVVFPPHGADVRGLDLSMSHVAIRAEQIGKCYAIGESAPYNRFSELLVDAATWPIRRLRQLGRRTPSKRQSIWAIRDVSFEVR